jgi:acetylornithine/succinyldiaminopimelate/putrescine aminotransferase
MSSLDSSVRTFHSSAVTPANRAFKGMNSDCLSAIQTCDQIIRLKIPNLLRLYLNPFVAQTCVALAEMVSEVWPANGSEGRRSSFLANSGEEALSGALKLARYAQNVGSQKNVAAAEHRTLATRVFLVDDGIHFRHFASTVVQSDQSEGPDEQVTIEFLPEMHSMSTAQFMARKELADVSKGILVLSSDALRDVHRSKDFQQAVMQFCGNDRCILIACLDQDLFSDRAMFQDDRPVPDIVVFDESFTRRQVPFGAFSARPELAALWTVKGMTNFHSTTFQPNTVSTMHFLKCLHEQDEPFYRQLLPSLKPLLVDHDLLHKTFRDLFSSSLAKLISLAGYDQDDVTASGHYIRVGNKRIFDGVGGVACSLRGHNPTDWAKEIRELDPVGDIRAEVQQRLEALTGLPHHVPAVSGAASVEHAIKLALTAHPSGSRIVAFQGGFGGKTLLALSGTAKGFYRQNIDPLYANVVYLDPFADDAADRLQQLAEQSPIAVMQLELIQGVGGVREIPETLLHSIEEVRRRTGAFLFVDEIQTGMFRTGPFVRSAGKSIQPDLLTIGKGISDMMFPFALTLYSDRIDDLLKARQSTLASDLQSKYSFELGYRALLNTLRRAELEDVSVQVSRAGQQFQEELTRQLHGVSLVRVVRCYGLLIGIELNCGKSLIQRVGLNAAQLYLLQMMNHSRCPVLMGFCQYEPHILKFTPPLTVTEEEVVSVCKTIADTLKASTIGMLFTAISALWRRRK